MKRIKLFFAVATLCATTFIGYNAYQHATMTEEERLIQANLEALMEDEFGSSSSWTCWSAQQSGEGYYRCGNPCVWVNGFEGKGSESTCYSN